MEQLWLLSLCLNLKFLPHSWHWKGLSPVWVLRWISSLVSFEKCLSQKLQAKGLPLRLHLLLEAFKCNFNSIGSGNFCPHSSQILSTWDFDLILGLPLRSLWPFWHKSGFCFADSTCSDNFWGPPKYFLQFSHSYGFTSPVWVFSWLSRSHLFFKTLLHR